MNLILPLPFLPRKKLTEGWGHLSSCRVSPGDQGEVRCCDHPTGRIHSWRADEWPLLSGEHHSYDPWSNPIPQALKSISITWWLQRGLLPYGCQNTVTVTHSKHQLSRNWSRGITSHSAVIKDTVEGFVLTKLVEWCLIWDIFTLEDMQQQPSTKVHIETLLMTLADFISATPLLRSTEVSLVSNISANYKFLFVVREG